MGKKTYFKVAFLWFITQLARKQFIASARAGIQTLFFDPSDLPKCFFNVYFLVYLHFFVKDKWVYLTGIRSITWNFNL